MPNQLVQLTSLPNGSIVDEIDVALPLRLRHVLPSTLFTISLSDLSSFVLRVDGSVIDVQTYKEWESLEAFYTETGYSLETTIDAWQGTVMNPDLEAQ